MEFVLLLQMAALMLCVTAIIQLIHIRLLKKELAKRDKAAFIHKGYWFEKNEITEGTDKNVCDKGTDRSRKKRIRQTTTRHKQVKYPPNHHAS